MTIRKHSTAVHLNPSDLSFYVFSGDEIKKLSAVKITSTVSFDALGNPTPGGLYDVAMGKCPIILREISQNRKSHANYFFEVREPKLPDFSEIHCYSFSYFLGPSSRNEICSTCLNDKENCTGHFGHIELVMPVFNPFFIKTLHNILSFTCLTCYKTQISNHLKSIVELQLKLVDAGYIIEAQDLETYKSETMAGQETATDSGIMMHPKVAEYAELLEKEPVNHFNATKNTEAIRTAIVHSTMRGNNSRVCQHCKCPLKRVKYTYKRLVVYIPKREMERRSKGGDEVEEIRGANKILFAEECREYLKSLFENDGEFLKLLFPVLKNTTDREFNIFFMDILPVIPPIVRPANYLRGELMEHPQTKVYNNVVSTNNQLRYILAFSKSKAVETDVFDGEILNEAEKIYEVSRGETSHEKIYYKWQELQENVNISRLTVQTFIRSLFVNLSLKGRHDIRFEYVHEQNETGRRVRTEANH